MATQAQIDARKTALADARTSFNSAAATWNSMATQFNAALPALRADGGDDPQPLIDKLNAIVVKATDAVPTLKSMLADAAAMVADAPAPTPTPVPTPTPTPTPNPTPAPQPIPGRPAWAANAPLNQWSDVPLVAGALPQPPAGIVNYLPAVLGTRPDLLPIPPNPTATNFYFRSAGILDAWSGFAFQRHASPRIGGPHSVIHLGPSGGHENDGEPNFIQRIVLGVEAPYMDWECNGTPGDLWYADCARWGYDPSRDPGPGTNTGFGQAHGGHSMYGNVFSAKKGWIVSVCPWDGPSPNPTAPVGYPYYCGNAANGFSGPFGQYSGKYITAYDVENYHWIEPEKLPFHPWGGTTSAPICVDYEKDDIYFGLLFQPYWLRLDLDNVQWVNANDGYPQGFGPAAFDSKHQRIVQTGIPETTIFARACYVDGTNKTITLTLTGDGAAMVNSQDSPPAGMGRAVRVSCLEPADPSLGCTFVHAVYDYDGFVTLYKWTEINETTYSVDKWDIPNRPPNGNLNGLYNKFYYAPELGGFVMLNRITEPVRFLRLV